MRVSELRSSTFSDTQAVENHCKGDLCLDNAFALIEGHPHANFVLRDFVWATGPTDPFYFGKESGLIAVDRVNL